MSVALEDFINNYSKKAYGAGPIRGRSNYILYQVVEEDEFTSRGDCMLLLSDHRVEQGEATYNEQESKAMIPLFKSVFRVVGEGTIRYVSFCLPASLKVSFRDVVIRNSAGLNF